MNGLPPPVASTPFRCSLAADARGDSMVATAPAAQRWVLVEHPGPWPVEAVEALGNTGRDLAARAADEQARVSLVRRPGRSLAPSEVLRYAVAELRPGREGLRWSTAADAAAVAAADWTVEAGQGEPLALVCAHGRHDVCCAVRGRPVAAALERRWPGRVWECSHLGGDRFAATLVLLPHGLYYGRVDPASGDAVLQRYELGHVEPGLLRGRSGLPRLGQAAQALARDAVPQRTGLDDLLPVQVRPLADGVAEVLLAGSPPLRVVLRERRVPLGSPATCRSSVAGVGHEYDLLTLEPAPPAN